MSAALKVCVVGCGVGKVHIDAFQTLPDLFEVVAVCDLDGDKSSAVAAQYGISQWFTDVDALYQRDDIDVFDFCTPPYQHYQQIMRALTAGKDVICEKPLVGSLAQVDQVIAASQQSGKRVMPILQYRFGHGLQKLKWLVDQGVAGRAYLSTVEIAWRRRAEYYASAWRGKWETELGGTLLNHAIHHLDMMLYVTGPARSVFARTASLVNDIEVEDTAAISLELMDGSLASLSATLGSARQISRHRFCFQHLSAESNTKPYSHSDDPWQFHGDTEQDDVKIQEALAAFKPNKGGFEEQFEGFYAAVRANGELPVGLTDARNLLEMMTAIYTSAQTNQLVSLPITIDHPKYTGWAPMQMNPAQPGEEGR